MSANTVSAEGVEMVGRRRSLCSGLARGVWTRACRLLSEPVVRAVARLEVTMAKKQPLVVRIVRVPSADAPHAQREAAKLLGQHLGELWVGDATTVTRGGAEIAVER